MKIKILIILFAVCLLLCSCADTQQSQHASGDNTTTTEDLQEMTTTEHNDTQNPQDDSDDVPSLFVTTEPETTVNLDDIFGDVFGDSFGSNQLPPIEWIEDPDYQPVLVTTAPPSQESSDTHDATTEETTQFDDSNILPEDVWDDEE